MSVEIPSLQRIFTALPKITLTEEDNRWSQSALIGADPDEYYQIRVYCDGYGLVFKSPHSGREGSMQLYCFVSDMRDLGNHVSSRMSPRESLKNHLFRVRPRVDYQFSDELSCFSRVLDTFTQPISFGYSNNNKWSAGTIVELPGVIAMFYLGIPIFGVNISKQIYYYNDPYVYLDKEELQDGPVYI